MSQELKSAGTGSAPPALRTQVEGKQDWADLVNFEDGLKRLAAGVLPRLEAMGLRESFPRP